MLRCIFDTCFWGLLLCAGCAFIQSAQAQVSLPASLVQLQQQQNAVIRQNNKLAYSRQSPAENYREVDSSRAELRKEGEKAEFRSIARAPHYRFADTSSEAFKTGRQGYLNAWNALGEMLSADTALSFKRAIYLVENACMNDKLPYDKFLALVQKKVSLVRYILRKEKLSESDPDAVHYAIQKLFSETLYVKQVNGTTRIIKPLHYDFNSPFGKSEQLVTKLLVTGQGQCHSMPLLYMLLCEEFKVKCYIAYSPEHSFIKFQTKNGTWYNYETTNGHLTTDAFVYGSGFIKSEALKSGIFNTPYDTKEVTANLFIDLANNYQEQFGYDNFQQKCVDMNLQYNKNYVYAKVVRANYQTALVDRALAQNGYPNPANLSKYPAINRQVELRNQYYNELDDLGFTDMPKEAYQKWLGSLKEEQQKQNSRDLQSQFQNSLKK